MPIPVTEPESDVLLLSKATQLTSKLENESGIWIRSCPICQAVLMKTEPCISLVCGCGWHWLG
jgi:hypothetical protein